MNYLEREERERIGRNGDNPREKVQCTVLQTCNVCFSRFSAWQRLARSIDRFEEKEASTNTASRACNRLLTVILYIYQIHIRVYIEITRRFWRSPDVGHESEFEISIVVGDERKKGGREGEIGF